MASDSLKKWFDRNDGKGWVDCNTGKSCGRKKGEKRKKYPACRPTMAQCTDAKKKKKGSKRISWKDGRVKKATGGHVSIKGQGIVMKDRLR
tara:strand:- start:262 stop:534 length:273 start_codon:yes stop_codon:yes gene_type:complete